MNTINNRLVAAALVFKLHKFARELESREHKSASDKRELLAIKALALVSTDRIKNNKRRA
jgi:hypothetical protein